MKTRRCSARWPRSAAFAGPAEAIYKCTTAKGVVYQDRPCREGTETDVRIVIPTGEVAPKSSATRTTTRGPTPPAAKTTPAPQARPHRRRRLRLPSGASQGPGSGAASADARKKEARTTTENDGRPDDRRPGAQDRSDGQVLRDRSVGPGNETPTQMNCESPTGEKRVFIPQQRQADVDLIRPHRVRRRATRHEKRACGTQALFLCPACECCRASRRSARAPATRSCVPQVRCPVSVIVRLPSPACGVPVRASR